MADEPTERCDCCLRVRPCPCDEPLIDDFNAWLAEDAEADAAELPKEFPP